MSEDKEKGILIFHTENGFQPVSPVDKDANLGDIMVMKEMFGDKKQKPDAVMIDDNLKWME